MALVAGSPWTQILSKSEETWAQYVSRSLIKYPDLFKTHPPGPDFKANLWEWQNNSCYLDSVMVALFLHPSTYLDQEVLYKDCDQLYQYFNEKQKKNLRGIAKKIQRHLLALVGFLRTPESVMDLPFVSTTTDYKLLKKYYAEKKIGKDFRVLLEKFEDVYNSVGTREKRNWWNPKRASSQINSTQQEPFDFIELLFFIFESKTNTQIQTKEVIIFENKDSEPYVVETNPQDQRPTIIFDFNASNLTRSGIILSQSQESYSQFKINSVIKSSYLHIRVTRLIITQEKNKIITKKIKTKFTKPPEYIEILNQPNLYLVSFIIHIGPPTGKSGHYVNYFRKGTIWFQYDDLDDLNLDLKKPQTKTKPEPEPKPKPKPMGNLNECWDRGFEKNAKGKLIKYSISENVTDLFYSLDQNM